MYPNFVLRWDWSFLKPRVETMPMTVPEKKATAGPIIMSATAPTATPPDSVALAMSITWMRLRLEEGKEQQLRCNKNWLGV